MVPLSVQLACLSHIITNISFLLLCMCQVVPDFSRSSIWWVLTGCTSGPGDPQMSPFLCWLSSWIYVGNLVNNVPNPLSFPAISWLILALHSLSLPSASLPLQRLHEIFQFTGTVSIRRFRWQLRSMLKSTGLWKGSRSLREEGESHVTEFL